MEGDHQFSTLHPPLSAPMPSTLHPPPSTLHSMPSLLLGLTLGLSAGFSPGPLMMLVITTTLRGGFWQGLRVAMAPFLSDVPIILLTLLVLDHLPSWALGAVGIVGGLYVIFLGWETIRSARDVDLTQMAQTAAASEADTTASRPVDTGRRSLLRGATVNALSPHPWLFWATVGGPTLIAAYNQSPVQAAAFLGGFYTTLIGSKVAVAALIHSQSHRLNTNWYRRILVVLGLLLIGLGLLLIGQGLLG